MFVNSSIYLCIYEFIHSSIHSSTNNKYLQNNDLFSYFFVISENLTKLNILKMSTAHQNGKYYFLKNNFFKSITSLKIVNLLKKYFLLDKISKKLVVFVVSWYFYFQKIILHFLQWAPDVYLISKLWSVVLIRRRHLKRGEAYIKVRKAI